MKINGYAIVAIIPSANANQDGLPETWFMVGVRDDGEAVCATTYDVDYSVRTNSWSSGNYFLPMRGEVPGRSYRQAMADALYKSRIAEEYSLPG